MENKMIKTKRTKGKKEKNAGIWLKKKITVK